MLEQVSVLRAAAAAAVMLAAASGAWAADRTAAGAARPARAGGGDAAMIGGAEKAAPPAVSRKASIMAMNTNGSMRMLRKGTNGFTCMPDDPQTPGPDPMCADANALAWIQAMAARKPPPQKAGFMYMLGGGTDASNTDPYARRPTGGNHWIKTGPHVMIVGDRGLLAGYPASPDPDTAAPYVMWAGTPYAHLMVPVK